MTSSGIRRKVDDLGRVVIPAGMRRTLGIREGDAIEVSVEGERVVLAKPRDACVFCGREEEDLTGFRGRLVCRDCLAALGSVDERLRATATAQTPAQAATPRTVAQLPDWDAPSRTDTTPPAPEPVAGRRPGRDGTEEAEHDRPPAAEPATADEPRAVDERGRGDEARRGDEAGDGDEAPDPSRHRRPPYDPASTTAW